ncbi:MAG: hypothetical protein KAJ66_04235 [Candidatus Omnitrophica bacterium]|nr:hypothetical protein [Candidatus Omnitrophota bacterium]
MIRILKKTAYMFVILLIIIAGGYGYNNVRKHLYENRQLKEVIRRLEADSRAADVLVTKVCYDENAGQNLTTIKFLEYDTEEKPLEPRYFTFSGNIIQFQSLVVRFDDIHIRSKDRLKGKSAYLFWKVFMLDGPDTQEYELVSMNEIPAGYKIEGIESEAEKRLWECFWQYALNPAEAEKRGIKNAQIEAPGTMFVPGTIYTLKIEHDGGLRIDAKPLPDILRGETIPQVD